jgi:capsid portal protein
MKAFNGCTELKQQLIDMAAEHRKADEYLKGTYGEEDQTTGKFRACSIGCTIRDVNKIHNKNLSTRNHGALAKELDIPEFIFHLQDSIFEGLPEPLNIEWTERIFNAIPVGKDLTPVLPRFLLKTLDRLPETDRTDVIASIKQVREVLQNWADTGAPDIETARTAWEQIANDLIECIEAV